MEGMIEMIVVTAAVRASEGGAEIEKKKKTVPEGDDGSKRERRWESIDS
jgi:hypothetical protein